MRGRSIEYPFAVGSYLVSEPIASGGQGTIHLAATEGPNARVLALKRLHPYIEDAQLYRNMLLDEAAITTRVRHPNVVTMHGVATLHERLFLVMDYVEGVSLDGLMRERFPGGLPPRVVVAIVAGALRGLHAAHELGVIHRDVSPRNILVGADGVARIVDFGIAKGPGRREITADGGIKGTLAYMAPEQVAGAAIDRRTDVFAAGIIL